MREPKYRGKTKSGDWIYGAYVAFEGLQGAIYFPIRHSKDNSVIKTDWMYVNPESVGQSTGLHDVTGIEIYEGDIIESPMPEGREPMRHLIVYRESEASFVATRYSNSCPVTQEWINFCNFRVVGNSIDNPTLIPN